MKRLSCAEVGIFPDCTWSGEGADEGEVMAQAAQHAREHHGLSDADLSPARIEAIRSRISDA